MKTGDIIFFRYEYRNFWQKLLMRVVDVVDGIAHHVAIAIDDKEVMEIEKNTGVTIRKILPDEIVAIYRSRTNISKSELLAYYREQIQTNYSMKDWLIAGVSKLIKMPINYDDKNGKICSEFVVKFFRRYKDIELTSKRTAITPNDILKSNQIFLVEGWHRWK
jgi:hypothetical protein